MSHKQYDQVANHPEDADVASGTRAGLQRIKKSFKTAHRDEEPEQNAGKKAEQSVGGIPPHRAYLPDASHSGRHAKKSSSPPTIINESAAPGYRSADCGIFRKMILPLSA